MWCQIHIYDLKVSCRFIYLSPLWETQMPTGSRLIRVSTGQDKSGQILALKFLSEEGSATQLC